MKTVLTVIGFDDLQLKNGNPGRDAYAHSMLANVFFTYELAGRVKETGITVNVAHPVVFITNFCKNNGWVRWSKHVIAHLPARSLVGPTEGARTSVDLATSSEVEGVSGEYFSNRKCCKSSNASYDKDAARAFGR